MAPSSELLRDFRGFGSPIAWGVMVAIIGGAFAVWGWTSWTGRAGHLLATYLLVHLSIALTRRIAGEMPTVLAVAMPAAFAFPAALATTAALHKANDVAEFRSASDVFDIGIAAGFVLAIIAGSMWARASEHRRSARAALALDGESRERQLAELRLALLQAQIEPHFIYNTLGNVQLLLRTSPHDADRMLDSLIRFLKSAIADMRGGSSTLGQELARATAYFDIMKFRMAERLHHEIHVAPDLHSMSIPPLGLMTLVENAVEHGLSPKSQGGTVKIEGRRIGNAYRLCVIDDGVGFNDEAGDGVGLYNLRERLATQFGSRASLELAHRAGGGVEATLLLPID